MGERVRAPDQVPNGFSVRSWSGRAASKSHSNDSRNDVAVDLALSSFSVSAIAHVRTYKSSYNASSSARATTNSFSLSCNSWARWRPTQSHCRQDWPQNSFLRPGPVCLGSTRRQYRQRGPVSRLTDFVMTK